MDKIKNILINIYKYSIIKADKNYISFECEKNDIDKLKNKILSINEKTLNTIKLYFLSNKLFAILMPINPRPIKPIFIYFLLVYWFIFNLIIDFILIINIRDI